MANCQGNISATVLTTTVETTVKQVSSISLIIISVFDILQKLLKFIINKPKNRVKSPENDNDYT